MTYELVLSGITGYPDCIRATDETGHVIFIPCDETNSDYQAYLESQTAQ